MCRYTPPGCRACSQSSGLMSSIAQQRMICHVSGNGDLVDEDKMPRTPPPLVSNWGIEQKGNLNVRVIGGVVVLKLVSDVKSWSGVLFTVTPRPMRPQVWQNLHWMLILAKWLLHAVGCVVAMFAIKHTTCIKSAGWIVNQRDCWLTPLQKNFGCSF